jgi:Mn2+/Fe2+ NRAMP family transporter
MPHSLYLGSGIVQPRLKEYDMAHDNIPAASDDDSGPVKYRPSLAAVRSCMKYIPFRLRSLRQQRHPYRCRSFSLQL